MVSVRVARSRMGIALLVLAALIALAVMLRIFVLPLGPDLAQAERALQGPPTFGYPGEHGPAVAHCTHGGMFGLLGSTDDCTLTFRSGDSYHCGVFQAG